jgi:predicted Zn-dependent protease
VQQNPTVLATMGTALIQTGKVDDGIKFMIEFRKYRPEDILALRVLADACKIKGDKEAEAFCTKQANDLSQGMALKLFHSAQLLLAAKKEALALGALRRALNYDSSSQEARYLIAQMAIHGNSAALDFAKELAEKSDADKNAYTKILEAIKH